MTLLTRAKKFVLPYYQNKDVMHNFSHVERIIRLAKKISYNYTIDKELIILGAYFHGVIHIDKKAIIAFLNQQNISKTKIDRIIGLAWDSQKDRKAKTIEGKILHDAHLLEGGKTYIITKSFITGTTRGQNLQENIKYIRNNIIGKFKCSLRDSQKAYAKKEKFAIEYLNDLEKNL